MNRNLMVRIVIFAAVVAAVSCLVAVASYMGADDVPSARKSFTVLSESSAPNAESLLNQTPLPEPITDPRIVIQKRARRLILFSEDKEVREFPIGLGSCPYGPKRREGDGRTPEGTYYVCTKNPNSKYYLSLGLSYPSDRDAARALRNHLINKSQYNAIVGAESSGACPPWNTPLGGAIFIHGRGSSRDWTLGCVSMDDAAIKVLYNAIPVGTPVEIVP